jgi:YidC/Oxa1 family membrane protein insertase
MENRRTALAIFLIALIWLIFNFLTASPQKKEVVNKNPQVATVTQAEKDANSEVLTSEVNAIPDNILPKQDIYTFSSPLYEISFSSFGGGILEYKLKNFTVENRADSENVKVIDLAESQGAFIFSGSENINLSKNLIYDLNTNLKSNYIDHPTDFYFSTEDNNFKITKKYTFYPDIYYFDLEIYVTNKNNTSISGSFALNIHTPWSKDKDADRYSFIGPVSYVDEKLHEDDPSDLLKESVNYKASSFWTSFTYKYFATIVKPYEEASGSLNISYDAKVSSVYNIINTKSVVLPPGKSITYKYRAYVGPRDYDLLSASKLSFEKIINLGFFGLIAHPLLVALNFFYKYLGNYGFAIVLLTICIKAAFWPLTQKSYASMKDMQKLQPQMQKLRAKYGKDKQKLNQEMMALYKDNRVNPFGGCLPMLVQIPVFFALYKVLLDAIELRHAPFIFWITDLSAADTLISDALNLGFALGPLPLIMGFTMFLQQKMAPTNMDPTQAKIMLFMPVFFTFIFLSFPSGLVVYWLVNNILTIAQQYLINIKKA